MVKKKKISRKAARKAGRVLGMDHYTATAKALAGEVLNQYKLQKKE